MRACACVRALLVCAHVCVCVWCVCGPVAAAEAREPLGRVGEGGQGGAAVLITAIIIIIRITMIIFRVKVRLKKI